MHLSLDHLAWALTALGISEADAAALTDVFRPRSIGKQGVWLERGGRCEAIAFIAEGALGIFYDRDGDEWATYIATRGGLMTALKSFVYQTPAPELIMSVAETELYEVSRADYYRWIDSSAEGWRNHARLLEYQLGCVDDSRREAITMTAAERYAKLIEQEPAVIQSAPLQVIASVLGVTPQHLSRIRRAMSTAADRT